MKCILRVLFSPLAVGDCSLRYCTTPCDIESMSAKFLYADVQAHIASLARYAPAFLRTVATANYAFVVDCENG